LFKAGQPDQFTAVVKYDLKQKKSFILRRKSELQLDTSYISRPKHVPFTTGSDDKAYLFYYPPRHPDYQAPPHTSPPLLVKTHGGPTSAALNTLDMRIQFWTSRGFAVADINYRGSTGYGKNFKDKLNKQWGIADVEDCARAASFLAKVDLADKNKIAIAGRSAGGFTTLAALTLKNIFKAGICYYGISDLKALAEATHKFEAHYLDHLIGPCPEAAAEYEKRSPLKHVNKLSCPVIFFQGLEDKVVPPTQAGMMVKALQNKNIYVEYHTFAHEQHGFRRADTIKKCLELEYKFLMKVFYKQETDRA
ncbi:MAG TPA: prolyl oligopeptidase family serine peptidase, partial [Spirochaetota bacterium]|nr:prolyl oligopeptidase family serine peptidase [Spirochaetota bacterium]